MNFIRGFISDPNIVFLDEPTLGLDVTAFPTFSNFSNMQLMGILAVAALVFTVASVFVYRWSLNRAKENGFFDMETSY